MGQPMTHDEKLGAMLTQLIVATNWQLELVRSPLGWRCSISTKESNVQVERPDKRDALGNALQAVVYELENQDPPELY